MKKFMEKGQIVVKKATVCKRKPGKCQDCLLKLIQLWYWGTTSAEVSQEWQQTGESICTHNEEKFSEKKLGVEGV